MSFYFGGGREVAAVAAPGEIGDPGRIGSGSSTVAACSFDGAGDPTRSTPEPCDISATPAPSLVSEPRKVDADPALPVSEPRKPTLDLAPAAPAEVVSGPSAADVTIARQKAVFVEQVHALAAGQKLSLQAACMMVAARAQADFPDLVRGGRGGASMLGAKNAWPNFRAWDRKLGRTQAGDPDAANWRALLPLYRGSRPYTRPGADEFWTIVAGFFENENRLPMAKAYQLAGLAWQKAGAPGEIPTYAQVHHYYQTQVDQKRVIIARFGEEYFRNSVAGYITRKAPRVGECWVGDHHIFDAPVRVLDQASGQWVAVRPWLTAWLDWGSLDFVGILIRAIPPNRDSIERCLRQAIVRTGFVPPLHLYIDNGKDYRAALGKRQLLDAEDQTRLRGIGDAIGVRTHFALPYNARAKIIERVFGSCATAFAKLCLGYRGSNPTERPEHAQEIWDKRVDDLPTIDQFASGFAQYLDQVYRITPSEGRTLEGRTPAQARILARPVRAPLDMDAIYKAFLRDIGVRKIERGGAVRALNRYYRSDSLWRLLANTEQVRVRVDPDNVDRVLVYDLAGREIGPADAVPEFMALTDGSPKAIEELRAEMQNQRRQIREAKQLSIAARELPRFLTTGGDMTSRVFELPEAAPAASAEPRRARPAQPDALDGVVVDDSLLADVDAAMRESAQARLAEDRVLLGD